MWRVTARSARGTVARKDFETEEAAIAQASIWDDYYPDRTVSVKKV